MHCVYCQNFHFSQSCHEDTQAPEEDLTKIMLELQNKGCHNINLVTPTHYLPSILQALKLAKEDGFRLPVVYNTSGYESIETLKTIDGTVDIYLADMKYSDNEQATKYSNAPDYVEANRQGILEMFKQVGDLVVDGAGIAKRGLIIRHLVLPSNLAGTKEILKFISKEISQKTYISLMSQYHPEYKALDFPLINRRITQEEYKQAVSILYKLGLDNGWIQGNIGDEEIKKFKGGGVNVNKNH